MELISREKLMEVIEPMAGKFDDEGDFYWSRESILRVIDNAPTIEERKEGKWIFKTVFPNDKSEFPMGYLVCSVCGSHHSNSTPCNYCDNCGAKMKGADDERHDI